MGLALGVGLALLSVFAVGAGSAVGLALGVGLAGV